MIPTPSKNDEDADEVFLRSPMSAFGVKRTCFFALHMSAYDPKRT